MSDRQKLNRLPLIQYLVLLFLVIANISIAKATSESFIDLVETEHKGRDLQLEVRRMPFVEVFGIISSKTNIPIHYSVLPEGLVTATCLGSNLKQILECLLDRKSDFIVRYHSTSGKVDINGQAAEVWILGSRIESTSSDKVDFTATAEKNAPTSKQNQQDAEPDQTDYLLKMALSDNPADKADAIGALKALGLKGDPRVKAVLEQALSDKDSRVRAQAIWSYASREGSSADWAIQEALQDSNVDVRILAVDAITDNIDLLKQAINDSDEFVRSSATLKLKELSNNTDTK
jgi:hypothetical protein